MFDRETWLYVASLGLQLAAMVYALRMARQRAVRGPWLVMAAALACMSVFRLVALLSTGPAPLVPLRESAFRALTANISLAISAMFFLSLFAIRRISRVHEAADAARIRAEASFRESELRLRAIFEQTFGSLAILNSDGTVVDVNHAPLEVGGFRKEDQVGRPFWETDWFAGMPQVQAQLREGIERAAGGAAVRQESEYPTASGERRTVDRSISPIRDDSGRVVYVIVEGRDITDRKRAEEQLRRAKQDAESANTAKDRFLAVLSHELRTPLTPVLLTVSMMQEDDDVPQRVRDELGTIRRNVEMEARLIDDLLDLTRITRGKLQLHSEFVDVHLLIRAAHDICCASATAGPTVTLRLEATRHWLRGDAARLQQVFWNLLTNAKKFTKADGRVEVRSSDVEGGRVRVEVVDSGIGIEPAMLPKVFQAFEQDESTARRFGGLGLGLAICKALVEMHGGTIEAFSEGTGRGARFVVDLPDARATPPRGDGNGNGDGAAGTGSAVTGLRILVVEDHGATSVAMRKLLVAMGHSVTTAATAAEAEAAWRAAPFDLLISDLGLPDASGHELMGRLRAHRPVRAIAVSGFGMAEDMKRSEEAGFVAHLTKPLDLRRLDKVIGEAMGAAPVGRAG